MRRRSKEKLPLPALDAAADTKTAFFMAATHQLKSPLAIIQWCIQSALEDKELTPATRSLLSRTILQANAMSHLLTDMLQTLRIVHNESEHKLLVPVNVNTLIDQVMDQYAATAAQSEVRLVKGAIEHLPLILADEQFLKQALINLVDNAIKYTPAHGRVEVRAHTKKGMLEVEVEDTGIGIADADQSKLFTEFFRAQPAKEKAREGTGLGLVLVRHIARGFGGDVSYKSALGKGTTFTLHLPVPKP